MTVKVVDKKLYDIYDIINIDGSTTEIEDVIKFVGAIADRIDSEELNDNADVGYIIKAIIDGEAVELYEPMYRVPMPAFQRNGQQEYLVKNSSGLDISPLSNIYIKTELKMDEIPNEYRQWAIKLEDSND